MDNYAEEIAYWYLRLNGFFPLPNLVTHRWGPPDPPGALRNWNLVEHSADADLIALRAPFTTEPIGGMPDDWDQLKFKEWGIPLEYAYVGLIVEVKSRPSGSRRKLAADQPGRIQYCLGRLGMFPPVQIEEIALVLKDAASVSRDSSHVGKLFVSDQRPPEHWLHLRLEEAEAFITKRLRLYAEKARDRMFFPSSLIQYLAVRGHSR